MTESLNEAVRRYADTVGEKLEEYLRRRGFGDRQLATREYRRMMLLFGELETMLNHDLRADEQRRLEIEQRLRALMSLGFPVVQARMITPIQTSFEEAQALLEEAKRRVLEEVVVHMDVPEELEATSQTWEEAAQVARAVDELMPTLRDTRGWKGQAASEYKTMASIQCDASVELVPLPQSMADAYSVLGTLNRAVLIAVHDALRTTVLAMQSRCEFAPGVIGGGLRKFVREMRCFLDQRLPAALDIAGEAVEKVGEAVEDTRRAPCVISQKWPSGSGGPRMKPGVTGGRPLAIFR